MYLCYNIQEDGEIMMEHVTVGRIHNEGKIAYIGNSSSITEKMTAVVKVLQAEEGKKGKIYANEDALNRNRVYFSEDSKEG